MIDEKVIRRDGIFFLHQTHMFYGSCVFGKLTKLILRLSRVVRKPAFCICENKDTDLLRGNREADQRLYFRYTDSTVPLLPKSEISSL